jgi:hypothetical protein
VATTPSLQTVNQVMSFLATDWETVEGLFARDVLSKPIDNEHGYDIDELLRTQPSSQYSYVRQRHLPSGALSFRLTRLTTM